MYQKMIREEIAKRGHIGIDPRHVEGFMRLEHGCLDSLSRAQFSKEVEIGISCIIEGGREMAERNAQSYAL